MSHAVEIFVCSAPADASALRELEERLEPLAAAGMVRPRAKTDLSSADLALILVSPEALADGSTTRAALEQAALMERERRATLVPLRLRPTETAGTPLAERVLFPRDGSSLEAPAEPERAWREAMKGVLEGVAKCHLMLGDILLEQERDAFAAASFRRAIVIAEGLVEDAPDDEPHLVLLAHSRDRLGDALLAAGDGPGAFRAFDSARVVRQRLVNDAPLHHDKRRALARCFESIGEVVRAMGEKTSALEAYRACLSLRDKLAEEIGDAASRRDLYTTHSRIGHVLRAMGDHEGALRAFQEGTDLAASLAAEHPKDVLFTADHALFHFRSATVLADGAPEEHARARVLLEKAKAMYLDLEERGVLPSGHAIWPPAVDALLDNL